MQGKQIIKGAVVFGVTLTFTSGTYAHTNQDHVRPDEEPVPVVEPAPPHAKVPRPHGPRWTIPHSPISFPSPGDPFTPTVVRSDPSAPQFTGAWVLGDNDPQGVLAPEFAPLPPLRLDIGVGLVKPVASDLFPDGRQPRATGSSSGGMVPSAVPGPGAIALLGLAALAVGRRRRRTGSSAP